MTGPKRPRAMFPVVIGVAALLAMVPVALVVWTEADGADHGALQELVADAPVPRGDGARTSGAIGDPGAGRPVQFLADVAPEPSGAPGGDTSLFVQDGSCFAGLPRAWIVPLAVHGRLVDETGAPFAGARVRFVPDSSTRELLRGANTERRRHAEVEAQVPSTLSGSDGRFTLTTARALGWLGLEESSRDDEIAPGILVDDPRCAAYLHRCDASAGGDVEVGTLVMAAGAVVAGRVLDADGRPVPDLRLQLSLDFDTEAVPGRPNAWTLPESQRITTTDAGGAYEFRNLWPAKGRVSIAAPGWRAAECDVPAWEIGGRVQAPDLTADHGGSLSGTIRTAAGQPLPGALAFAIAGPSWSFDDEAHVAAAWAAWSRSDTRRGVPAGDDGRFTLTGLDNAPFTVIAGAPGCRPAMLRDAWPDTPDVELTLQPDARYAEHAMLAVQVTDVAGAPLCEALLRATVMPPGARNAVRLPQEEMGPGAFTIRGAGGTPVDVLVMAPGFATKSLSLMAPGGLAASAWALEAALAGAHAPQRIALASEARVAGRVLDGAGAPMPGLVVVVVPAQTSATDGRKSHAVTDADGRFSIGGLGAGAWFGSAVGADVCQAERTPLELSAGEHREGVALVVARRASLQGRVCYRDGTAARMRSWSGSSRAMVSIDAPEHDARTWRQLEVDADGSFRVDGLLPGTCVVSTSVTDELRVELRSGETTVVNLVAPRPPVVRGRVLAGDLPAPGVRVTSEILARRAAVAAGWILCFETEAETALTDADGRFALELLGEGETAVWALSPAGGRSTEATVSLGGDQEARVELRLPTGRIEGDVVDVVTGAPVPGADVRTAEGVVKADGAGHFVLENLPPGSCVVWAKAEGYLISRLPPAVVTADAPTTGMRFALERAARLQVTVLAPNGKPMASNVPVMVWRSGVGLPDRTSDSQLTAVRGHAAFEELAPATYRVGAADDAGRPSFNDQRPREERFPDSVEVSVVAGETREVVLHIRPRP